MVDVALAAREAKAASAQKLTSADEKNDMNKSQLSTTALQSLRHSDRSFVAELQRQYFQGFLNGFPPMMNPTPVQYDATQFTCMKSEL
jgi:hypothetical protein